MASHHWARLGPRQALGLAVGWLLCAGAGGAAAAGPAPWAVKAWGGLGQLGDASVRGSDGAPSPAGKAGFDAGFATGAGLAWRFHGDWALEADFLYRTNDQKQPALLDGDAGDYSSGQLALRLSRHWSELQWAGWSPVLTAGLAYGQEIDIDAETATRETSYSADDSLGIEVGGRLTRALAPRWQLDVELRHVRFDGVNMRAEGGAGGAVEADYAHTALLLGLGWSWGTAARD